MYEAARYYLSCLALLLTGGALLGTDIHLGAVVLHRSATFGACFIMSALLFIVARLLRRQ